MKNSWLTQPSLALPKASKVLQPTSSSINIPKIPWGGGGEEDFVEMADSGIGQSKK